MRSRNGIASRPAGPGPEEKTLPLNAAEREAIDLMVNLASAVGLPRTVAEMYGLLFVAPDPLALDDFTGRLGISAGSASQGLRLLRNLGAVEPVIRPGDRRTFYRAETRLKVIIPGFLREQVLPRLEGWPQRVVLLNRAADDLQPRQQRLVRDRAKQLHGWHARAKMAMPAIMKLVGS